MGIRADDESFAGGRVAIFIFVGGSAFESRGRRQRVGRQARGASEARGNGARGSPCCAACRGRCGTPAPISPRHADVIDTAAAALAAGTTSCTTLSTKGRCWRTRRATTLATTRGWAKWRSCARRARRRAHFRDPSGALCRVDVAARGSRSARASVVGILGGGVAGGAACGSGERVDARADAVRARDAGASQRGQWVGARGVGGGVPARLVFTRTLLRYRNVIEPVIVVLAAVAITSLVVGAEAQPDVEPRPSKLSYSSAGTSKVTRFDWKPRVL